MFPLFSSCEIESIFIKETLPPPKKFKMFFKIQS